MTAERWRAVREILYAASEMDAPARERYLNEACGPDSELRAEVERLLAALNGSGDFLEPAGRPPEPGASSRIGPYLILNEAARGGMGVVYQAVRADDYQQKVAIKLIKRDLETEFLIARFRQERQVLALLNHPNIARILDGGTTADGRPYLVMEWVDGQPITEYCATKSLGLRSRLELFLDVAEAVAHAHRNLVVHRDLKPSNILITAEGNPKLLDFGIAKILNPEMMDGAPTLATAQTRALTPDYASPEQVRGEPATTATDIYSLGAVLFELLTGCRAHRFETRTPVEIERVVCTQRLVAPSRVTAEGGSPARQLRGDLDNVVLKALEKDPARRYATVLDFAADVRRYLEGRPVVARPASAWRRASKFTRRNKALVGAAAVAVLALAAGTVVALWQAQAARQQRAAAERRFELARSVAGSLLFEIHDAIAELAGASQAREIVLRRSLEYLDALSREAGSSTELERDLANGYERAATLQGAAGQTNLGNRDAAARSLRKALALREQVLAANPRSVASRRELAATHRAVVLLGGDGAEMLRHAGAALQILDELRRQKPGDRGLDREAAESEFCEARSLVALARYPEAMVHYRNAIAYAAPADPVNVPLYRKSLGAVLIETNDLPGALQEYRAAAALDEAQVRARPTDSRRKLDLSFDYSDWAFILVRMKKPAEAVRIYRRAEAIRLSAAAADPRDARAAGALVSVERRMAVAMADAGDRQGSEASFRKAVRAAESAIRTVPNPKVGKQALADTCWYFGRTYKEQWSSCAQARAWLTRARDLYRELNLPSSGSEKALSECASRP